MCKLHIRIQFPLKSYSWHPWAHIYVPQHLAGVVAAGPRPVHTAAANLGCGPSQPAHSLAGIRIFDPCVRERDIFVAMRSIPDTGVNNWNFKIL